MGNTFTTPAASPPTGLGAAPVTSALGSYLTSQGELERLYSQVGVELRTLDGNDTDILDEIIAWASETVASYTLHHYDTTELLTSPWARRRATVLAAYYLSQRRGNPAQFVAEAKRVMEDLELVRTNKVLIPDARVRAADVPAISSFRIDDRYWINKQRVVKSQSTKPTSEQATYELPAMGGDFY